MMKFKKKSNFEGAVTMEIINYINNYQKLLVDAMLYEEVISKSTNLPCRNLKSYRDSMLLGEIQNCERWVKKNIHKCV